MSVVVVAVDCVVVNLSRHPVLCQLYSQSNPLQPYISQLPSGLQDDALLFLHH